ncbi:conserved hypothetical protein [Vibrio jasicida]|uniref:DUF6602 domain-containing protein n=1 Tax=Vibrio TaxID=662 RepID=UPI002894B5C4|nr:DUF6602 domain-containing protein [Vibrio alfacsensis]EIT7028572.1 hypothetical protein [Vibrio vulnificus]WQE77257.1 DUF6602 domain-containing protein [Vibrio alfacsensis]CAH1542612.1 conserved hypothetical protein [Vibrio jasicida]
MVLYQNYAKELISKIGRLNLLVNHAPSIGTFHENIVSNYLKNFLSRRFSVKTGFVFNTASHEVSPQLDILVIDENVPSAYLFQDGEFVVAVPEAVVCAIEIKTNFDKDAFEDIAKKSEKYRIANPQGHNLFALCFNSTVKVETLSQWYELQTISDSWLNYPSEITILDRYVIKSFPEPLVKPSGACRIVCNDEHSKEEALLTYFLFSVMKLCELKAGINDTRTISAIFAGDFDSLYTIKHEVFKYGVGRRELEELNGADGSTKYRRQP